jgi:alpha-beta hydrolase superfamily lysophospholipase
MAEQSTTTTKDGFFPGHRDGLPVYYKTWIPKTLPIGRILAFHGLGEHTNRYNHLFTYFAEQGFVVRGFDYRGHGETIKKRSGLTDATKDDVVFVCQFLMCTDWTCANR